MGDQTSDFFQMTLGTAIISTFITAVVVATLGIFVFRTVVQSVQQTFGGVAAGVLNAVSIMVFGMAYRNVAKRLTDWENHRTESDYENNLILKNFVFQFVNSYVSSHHLLLTLLYIIILYCLHQRTSCSLWIEHGTMLS